MLSSRQAACCTSVHHHHHKTAPGGAVFHRLSRGGGLRRNFVVNASKASIFCWRSGGVFHSERRVGKLKTPDGVYGFRQGRDWGSDLRWNLRRGGRVGAVRAQAEGGEDDEGTESVDDEGEKVTGEEDEDKVTTNTGREDGFTRVREAIAIGSKRYYQRFVKESRDDAGVDIEALKAQAGDLLEKLKEETRNAAEVAQQRVQELRERLDGGTETVGTIQRKYWPQFVEWNRWKLWKDVKNWNAQRVGALVLYGLLLGASTRGVYSTVRDLRLSTSEQKLGVAYLDSVIPEPTEENLQRFKKGLWRQQMPEGFRAQKFVAGPDGEFRRDPKYFGDIAWQESDDEGESVEKIVEEAGLTEEQKAELAELIDENRAERALPPRNSSPVAEDETPDGSFDDDIKEGIGPSTTSIEGAMKPTESTNGSQGRNWVERLKAWDELIYKEQLQELVDQDRTKYVVPINHQELEMNRAKEIEEKDLQASHQWAFWVARRWWKYRPKLPYTYLLSKVENLEVAAAVYSCDTRKLFVFMRDGFPSEYVVDIPVDPYLYEALTKCGVEVDVLTKSNFEFFGRAFLSLLPTLLMIVYIRYIQYRAKEKFSEKIYDLLKMNRRQLILPEDAADKAKSQYKDVIVGGDVWMVLDEVMTYMRNPMKYFSKGVKLPRGILISGPPGTGKTLLARSIARESGLPFVFASGAEFVESSSGNGSDKIFDIFFTARANAPSFVFIDEIDALAGKNVNDDAERRATFQQLLAELDGEPDDTDVDRFALRQSVILICATNRPDELDESFMRPGRIDREIHIGLPGEKERVSIFGVHSSGKPLAKDVDFRKLVYRTLGYSGADIRNLINEAGIMAVRNKHEEITQHDFVEVLDKQLFEGMGMSITDDEQLRTQETIPLDSKRLLAVHEAGHILLAHLYPQFDWHAFSHLLPGGSEYALTVFYPRQEMVQQGHTTVGYLHMQMVVAHGGRCAERIFFGDNVSDGGQDDLQKITRIARELTISLSNRRFGLFPMKWQETLDPPKRPDETDLIPNEWDKPGSQIVQMSTEFSELFTRELNKYIDDTEHEAMEALQKNEHILRKLTEELLAKTKLSGFEAEDIIMSMDPVMLPDPLVEPMNNTDEDLERVGPSIQGRYEEMIIYPAPLHRC